MKMRDFWESLSLAFLLAVFFRVFLFSVYKIPTNSMAPTLWAGDFILTSKISYGIQLPFLPWKLGQKYPKPGDVIVFQWPDKINIPYVKRVLAIAGDHILIKENKVFVNEKELVQKEVENRWVGISDLHLMSFFEEEDAKGTHPIMHSKNMTITNEIGPFIVPPGEVFVLGDNRDGSDDSRYFGLIPLRMIEGKVQFIWLSFDSNENWAEKSWSHLRLERTFNWLK
jgi:signal peptidase I